MRTRYQALAIVALVPLLAGVGCSRVKAKAAFKDGNRLYKEENFRKAMEVYERAVTQDPSMAEAHFYLASSAQALYRPGKEGAENKELLDKSIEHYKLALDGNKADSVNLKRLRLNTLGALTGIYSEPPYQDFEKALSYAQQLLKDNPNDTRNLYAIANLYEKFGKIQEAEETYNKVVELNPKDVKACGALAAFYNKPLWDGKSKFDQAIQVLERCASLDPNDASGYYKVATFYWDKAYRDPLLTDAQKDTYSDKGLEEIEKALKIRPEYWEAIISKGLLYRVKAQVAKNPKQRQQFLEQAQTLQKQAMEMRKEQQAQGGPGAVTPTPGSPEAPAPH
ncbi:MAG TPA: tetratricopeptide repeat protein [Vicinamibacteria bacterium]|jgi:tetratricopeptide (TPR) repeat protein|nr:tetratricopeptide repeat protein [Vicinamibacteria bacterium]